MTDNLDLKCPACGLPATVDRFTSAKGGVVYDVVQYKCENTNTRKPSNNSRLPFKPKKGTHPPVKIETPRNDPTYKRVSEVRVSETNIEADFEPLKPGAEVQVGGQTAYTVPQNREAVIHSLEQEADLSPPPFPDVLPEFRYQIDYLLQLTPDGRAAFLDLAAAASQLAATKQAYDHQKEVFLRLQAEFKAKHAPT